TAANAVSRITGRTWPAVVHCRRILAHHPLSDIGSATMNVRVYATLRPIVGGKEADLAVGPGDTFRQMIDEMLVRWPGLQRELFDATGDLRSSNRIFLNGRDLGYL